MVYPSVRIYSSCACVLLEFRCSLDRLLLAFCSLGKDPYRKTHVFSLKSLPLIDPVVGRPTDDQPPLPGHHNCATALYLLYTHSVSIEHRASAREAKVAWARCYGSRCVPLPSHLLFSSGITAWKFKMQSGARKKNRIDNKR